MAKIKFEEIVSHLQVSGYVFPGSQIYGGLANAWDYGPLGVLFKNNVKAAWWKKFVQEQFVKYYNNGYLEEKEEEQLYCEHCKLFLADRYIIGICPK